MPNHLRLASWPVGAFLSLIILFAIWSIVKLGLELVLTPDKRFTSARTLLYSDWLIPSDLRLFACPVPCLPSITSFASCSMDLLGLEAGFAPSFLFTRFCTA